MSVTRTDLLRAQSFLRRRMLAAVAFGSPDVTGRAVSPLRSVVVGLALSALLLAGSFAFGRLSGRPPPDWLDDHTLLRERGSGRLFLVAHPTGRPARLTPVPNRASAHLLSGTAQLRTVEVAPRWIGTVPAGAAAGVVGAPDAPHWGALGAWTACVTSGTGLRLAADDQAPGRPADPQGAAVRGPDGVLWLVASRPGAAAHRFRVEEHHRRLVDLLALTIRLVPQEWLALFEQGPPITSSPPPGAGAASPQVPGHRVGDVLATGRGFALVTAGGPVAISPFTATVLEARTGRPAVLTDEAFPGAVAMPAGQDGWPDTFPPEATAPCAGWAAGTGTVALVEQPRTWTTRPVALRAVLDTDWWVRHGALPEGAGPSAQPGSSQSGSQSGSSETVVLVDEWGTCYPVLGEGTVAALGVRAADLPVVDRAWLDLVPTCHVLSRERARARGEP